MALIFIFSFLFTGEHVCAADIDTLKQPDILVTANRQPESAFDVISSLTIIQRSDIVNLQAQDILDILRLQTGIDISRNGGPGSTASVFLRGSNSDQVLVLIDGVNVSSNITGSFAWENLPANQIERIEIIRGSKASVYGSDAIGGVIQIFTRNNDRFNMAYTGGSFDTHNIDIGWGQSLNEGYFSIMGASQKTDGFSASRPSWFAYDADDDGYENLSLNVQAGTTVGKGNISVSYLQTRGDIDFDQGNSDSRNENIQFSYDSSFNQNWRHDLQLAYQQSRLNTPVFDSQFDSQRSELNWLLFYSSDASSSRWTAGFQWNREEAVIPASANATTGTFLNSDRHNLALFGQWKGHYDAHDLQASIRYDDNDAYGDELTGDLAWSMRFSQNHKIKAQVGTAFKAPNLSELFTQAFGGATFFGNADLKPEKSSQIELGYVFDLGNHWFESVIFQNRIADLIDFRFNADFTRGTYVNVDEAEISGLELSHQWQTDLWQVTTNSTWQNPVNVTGSKSEQLLRRPKFKWNISGYRNLNNFKLGAHLRYASKRNDFSNQLGSYLTADITFDWRVNDNWQIGVKGVNVTDKDYQLADGFNTMPAAVFATVRWQAL